MSRTSETKILSALTKTMPLVTDLLNELKQRGLQPAVIADRRALIPGGTVQLDLLPPARVTTASLTIKSVHPIGKRFEDPDCYVVTEIVIDDCDVIKPTATMAAANLCDSIARCPSFNSSTPVREGPKDQHDCNRKHRSRQARRHHRRRFNNDNYGDHSSVTHRCKFARY